VEEEGRRSTARGEGGEINKKQEGSRRVKVGEISGREAKTEAEKKGTERHGEW